MPPLRNPSSTAEIAAFVVFAAIAIVGALSTVLARSPIRAAVGLFAHIVALAVLYLDLGAHFLGVIQLLVYAGAVVVLFVFVIMLLGPASNTPRDPRGRITRIAAVVGVAAIGWGVTWSVLFLRKQLPSRTDDYGTITQVGMALFTKAAVPFELLGILLVIAIVGAFAIGRGHHHRMPLSGKGTKPLAEKASSEDEVKS